VDCEAHAPHNPHSSVSTHSRHQPAATWVNTTRYCKYSQVLMMMGLKHRPKHVDLTWNSKLIYIAHLVGYFHRYVCAFVVPSEYAEVKSSE